MGFAWFWKQNKQNLLYDTWMLTADQLSVTLSVSFTLTLFCIRQWRHNCASSNHQINCMQTIWMLSTLQILRFNLGYQVEIFCFVCSIQKAFTVHWNCYFTVILPMIGLRLFVAAYGLRHGSWPLGCGDTGLESHWRHGCLSGSSMLCCLVGVKA
jgi:hypothetical protein